MNATAALTIVGGLGLFLLGIHHLTEGLKGLAGDSLRRALQTLVGGRLSAVVSGALFTVAIQSSTATTLTVIGFVSAGLVTFSQAVGVIVGATFGTTSTPWLVAIFGFSRERFCLCHAAARHRRLSLADRQRPNAILGSDPRRLRTALLRDRISPDRDGRHFVEPRCRWWKRFRLAVDSRRNRDPDVDCHAELECCRGDHARSTACGLAEV